MTQIKIFCARDEVLSDTKAATEQQVNDWLRDELPKGATVQAASSLAYANGKFIMMVTLTVVTPDA